MSTSKERGGKTCIIWPKRQKIYHIIVKSLFFRFQLDNELHSVYEHFKSWLFIKSPSFYLSNSESNVSHQSSHYQYTQNSSLTHPTGTSGWFFFRKKLDISYRHIYLGHPLKLNGVWAFIILGNFTGATPSDVSNDEESVLDYGTASSIESIISSDINSD